MQILNEGSTFCYAEQPQMQAEVILASQGPGLKPIYTIRTRYPRPIHGEIMTHRVFGRNARSSRAVPVRTMLNEVRTIPYVPWHWGKNQAGMQADEECDALIVMDAFLRDEDQGFSRMMEAEFTNEEAWIHARDAAVQVAEAFMNAGYHKQNPNRLLEPFSWIDTLITSTEWDNFFWLREHHAAEPHLQDLAHLMDVVMNCAYPDPLEYGEWHLPYITEEEKTQYASEVSLKLSAARCARISYKPFDGDASIEKELARYNHLVTDERVHASPLEHQAKPDVLTLAGWENPHLHGNLNGYIQARKLVPNEVYAG